MKEWVEKAQQGDAEAFGQLMMHFRRMAYAVSYDRLKDVHLRKNAAVQAAFIEAYQNLNKLQMASAFPGCRSRKLLSDSASEYCGGSSIQCLHWTEPLHISGEVQGVAEIAERREESKLLQQSVEELSIKLRVPLRLFYFYGYSLQEISDLSRHSSP